MRGNPNSRAISIQSKELLKDVYANPWQMGYYISSDGRERDPRDGHFWYRMAKMFKDSEFLWAAERVILGGRPPHGKVSPEYLKAYAERFFWFNQRGIKPKAPDGKLAIGLLSPLKHKVPERLYLCPGRQSGKPFVSYFLYYGEGSHLCPNGAGRLYEYCVDGAKLLHSSGKYNFVVGQGAYDSLLVIDPAYGFPVGEEKTETTVDRGGKVIEESLRAENIAGDSFGQFDYVDYFGKGSRWTRQTVLTQEGYLIVRDLYVAGESVDGFQAGPWWLLRAEENVPEGGDRNWFDAPAWDRAWWQKQAKRVLLYIHPGAGQAYGVAQHATSGDISHTVKTNNSYAKATVKGGERKLFLTVLIPHDATEKPQELVGRIKTDVDPKGNTTAKIDELSVTINVDGKWAVRR